MVIFFTVCTNPILVIWAYIYTVLKERTCPWLMNKLTYPAVLRWRKYMWNIETLNVRPRPNSRLMKRTTDCVQLFLWWPPRKQETFSGILFQVYNLGSNYRNLSFSNANHAPFERWIIAAPYSWLFIVFKNHFSRYDFMTILSKISPTKKWNRKSYQQPRNSRPKITRKRCGRARTTYTRITKPGKPIQNVKKYKYKKFVVFKFGHTVSGTINTRRCRLSHEYRRVVDKLFTSAARKTAEKW